jgi:hypothetical protein
MPKFRGPINLHLGFDEKAGKPDVSSEYDHRARNYIVRLSASAKSKWQAALDEHGFSEEKDDDAEPDSKANDSKE